MKYLLYGGPLPSSPSSSYTNAYGGISSTYSTYVTNYTASAISLWPIRHNNEDIAIWQTCRLSIGYASGNNYKVIATAYGSTNRSYAVLDEYSSSMYLTAGRGQSSTNGLSVMAGPCYVYGTDSQIEALIDTLSGNDRRREFAEMPTRTITGTFKPAADVWEYTAYDANAQYTLTTLYGAEYGGAAFTSYFIPLAFRYGGIPYKALAVCPYFNDENRTCLALFEEYPDIVCDEDFGGTEEYIVIPSFRISSSNQAYIPDMADRVIEFIAGDDMPQDTLEFDEAEMPESLARFIEANFEAAGEPYSYTVEGIEGKATWQMAEPYEKMAVTAENATVTLVFTDGGGQTVNMAFATGKDPAEYAVTGARLYDGDTGNEIGFCEVGESINLPADVYNLTITVEYTNTPQGEDITAYFYENAAEKNRVDKTAYLTEAFVQRGYLRSACDVTNPVLVFEYAGPSIPAFNYVYIPRFSRYYYLEKLVIIDTGLYEMYLKVDVLNSYKDTIKAQAGTVARNQYEYNEALTDGQRGVENTPHTAKHALTIEGTAIIQGLGDLSIDSPACYVISVLTSQD